MLGLPLALAVEQIPAAIIQMTALQQDVVRNQLLAVGMQHGGKPLQQLIHICRRLQRSAARPWDRLRRRTAGHHISWLQETGTAAAQQLNQPALFVGAPEIPLVQDQQQAFAQGGNGLEHRHLRTAQVAIHHHQQQIRTTSPSSGGFFTAEAAVARLENSGCIDQAQPPLQPLQP